MVEERLTDGQRIATLLRAEIRGRETAGLDGLAVTDGTRIVVDGRVLAELEPQPEGLSVRFLEEGDAAVVGDAVRNRADAHGDLSVPAAADGIALRVGSAAAIKPALDVLVDVAGAPD